MMTNTETVYVIILNYNGFSDTLECVNSVKASDYDNLKIVVVDNLSTDGSFKHLSSKLDDDVILIQTDKNLGYAGGNNIGIKYALENNADYICVLNNDTIINENTISICIDELKKDNKIAFLGPTIMEYDSNTVQSTGGDINILKGIVTLKNNGKSINQLDNRIICDYVGGACLFFQSDIINKVGLIPENYFLFFEETEWCYRAKKMGYKNLCISNTYIRHKGSASIKVIGGLQEYLMERNRVVFVKRNVDNFFEYTAFLIYQIIKIFYWVLTKNKRYLSYLVAFFDGVFNRVNYKKYPFIHIKED